MINLFLDNGLFSLYHIIALVITVIYIGVLVFFSRKLSLDKCTKILLIIGIISETIKVVTYVNRNYTLHDSSYLPKSDLPFHLCSIQIIFMIILNLTKNEKLKRFLYSFMVPSCLVGGFMALIIAVWSSRNIPIITFQYFMYHGAIIAYAIKLLMTDEIEFTIKDMGNAFIMLFSMFFIATYINSIVADGVSDVNFMYVTYPPMKDLPYLNMNQGWIGYILKYASIAILAILL